MKKLLSYLLVAIMMLSLVACGSDKKADKKEEVKETTADAVEVLEKAVDSFSSVNAVEANLTIAGNATAEGQQAEVKATLDMLLNNVGKDNMEMKLPVELNVTGQDPIEATLYYTDGTIYADTAALLGQNLKLELDLSDIASVLETGSEEVETETTDEEDAKIKEALNLEIKETSDKYILSMDIVWDKLYAMMTEEVAAEDLASLEAIDFKTFKMTMSATKDGVIDAITLNVDASMDVEGTVVDVTIDGNIEFKTGTVDITFPDFSNYVDANALIQQMMGN